MKTLKEKDIAALARDGVKIIDHLGRDVIPFRTEKPKAEVKPRQSRVTTYFGQILAVMAETMAERKATRSVLERIAETLFERLVPKVPEKKPTGYSMKVKRDSKGLLDEIEVKLKY